MKLKEICNFREGYVNPPQGTADYFDGPVKWVRANDVNFAPIYSTSRTLSLQGFKSAGKSAILFKPDTIVVTKSGTIGRSAIIKDFMCGNRAIINVELKSNDNVDTKFVYYFLSTNQSYLQSLAVGTTQLNLYIFNLQEVEIIFPEKKIRQHIVNTIGSVDDLIECNNKFLRAAQQLLSIKYKSYCLFTDEKSELSLLVERTGKILKNKEWFNSKIIDLSTMPNDNIFIDDFSDGDNFTTNVKTVNDMDLLYGSIRPYFKKAGFNWNSKYIAGSVYSFSPKHESDFLWILATICSDDFHKYTASNSQGTKMPIINWDTFIRYKVPYSKQISEKFTKELKPLFMKAVLKLKQNEILKTIKKKLLEKYF